MSTKNNTAERRVTENFEKKRLRLNVRSLYEISELCVKKDIHYRQI